MSSLRLWLAAFLYVLNADRDCWTPIRITIPLRSFAIAGYNQFISSIFVCVSWLLCPSKTFWRLFLRNTTYFELTQYFTIGLLGQALAWDLSDQLWLLKICDALFCNTFMFSMYICIFTDSMLLIPTSCIPLALGGNIPIQAWPQALRSACIHTDSMHLWNLRRLSQQSIWGLLHAVKWIVQSKANMLKTHSPLSRKLHLGASHVIPILG